jgi:ribosomal protein S18 acetylase RimI-like enzyme
MHDEQLRRTAWGSIAAFQRVIGTHAPGARLSDAEQYVASAVPELPSSLINCAVPVDGAALGPHLNEIEDFYADSPKWGAWLDPAATNDADELQTRGLVLDSTPVLMAAALDDIVGLSDSPAAERVEPREVGAVNDLANDVPQPVFARVTSPLPRDRVHAYGARVDDQVAAVLILADAGRDAFVTLVATLPQHRGNHLASNLLSAALTEARQRGQTTTSLQASKAGQGIYARLGYRPLGEVHLYEKRPV